MRYEDAISVIYVCGTHTFFMSYDTSTKRGMLHVLMIRFIFSSLISTYSSGHLEVQSNVQVTRGFDAKPVSLIRSLCTQA